MLYYIKHKNILTKVEFFEYLLPYTIYQDQLSDTSAASTLDIRLLVLVDSEKLECTKVGDIHIKFHGDPQIGSRVMEENRSTC